MHVVRRFTRAKPSERSGTSPDTSQRGELHFVERAAWVAVALLTLGLFVASVPAFYEQHLVVCGQGAECQYPRLKHASALALKDMGISVDAYAVYDTVVGVAFSAAWFAVAAIIYWYRSAERMALFVSLFLVTFGGVTFGSPTQALKVAYPALWLPLQCAYFLGAASFFLFFYLFPDGRFVPRWTRWMAVAAVAWAMLISFFPGSVFNLEVAASPIEYLLWLVFFVTMAFAQVYRYRYVSGPAERQQIKWVVFGATTAVTVFASLQLPYVLAPSLDEPGSLYDLVVDTPAAMCMLLIPLSIGVAVLRYRLWDIDIVINRTLVYAMLTISVVGLYVLVVGGLGVLLQARGNRLISLFATGLVAVLFGPLRNRLQRGVNRLMYGKRDEPYAVLSRLGSQLETSIAPKAVLAAIVETVAQALKLPYVAITLKQDGEYAEAARYGNKEASGQLLSVPLNYQNETVGNLLLAPRAPGEDFGISDLQLLQDLSRQIGVAAHDVRLTADLQRSRERLVTAREEERRRLRRDLHDGVGPQLAALMLELETASDLVSDNPDASALMAKLSERARDVVSDVRRSVHALRPPALDELGLVGALEEVADQYRRSGLRVSVEAPVELPPLPAAVEVACYRIGQEAITNVVRHAEADNCWARIMLDEEAHAMYLEVEDDGRGIREEDSSGVGMSSMRERAEELGGNCTVNPLTGGGTLVSALLPFRTTEDAHRREE